MPLHVRPDQFHYASRRSDVFADNIVATSQPLATQAGLDMLRRGGNAIDAALATAICLTVVEPTSNGIGSDAFAIISSGGELHGFNGSGKSPAAWTPERFGQDRRRIEIGWDSVTVPGAVDTWVQLSNRFGRLDFAELFEPAIRYAKNGFHVTPVIQRQWAGAVDLFGHFEAFRDTFLPGGRAPEVGELMRLPEHAASLEKIASSRGEAFYRGELAQQMAADCQSHGGVMSMDDLAAHSGFWVEPISQQYGNIRVHEIPPNGQGLGALIALGILEHLDLGAQPVDSPQSMHLQIEAMKLAFVDAFTEIADPGHMNCSWQDLLDPARLQKLAQTISPHRALELVSPRRRDRGTVYLCSADAEGNMVSMIQSNFEGFGSGIEVPGTGISLQNRGAGFTLEPGHANQVAGGKRPFHTIIPGFITDKDGAVGPFGVMGAHMQAQGQVQVVLRMFEYGQQPQEAMDAPRWHISEGFELSLEAGFPDGTRAALEQLGHKFEAETGWGTFGGGQSIMRGAHGLRAASDPRKDGAAAGF